MIISIIATTVAPASAGADAVSDKKAQAAALAQKINAEGQQVEILAEQFNGATLHLEQVRQQLADAEQRLAEAQAMAEHNRAALAQEAVLAYIHGGLATSPTMKSFDGSVDLAVQQGYFRLATSNQADALAKLRQSEQQFHQQQLALLSAKHDSQAALATVTSRQQAVQAAAATSQATLGQVQGDLVQLVAEQQAQIAAQQQAQAQNQILAAAVRSGGAAPPGLTRSGPVAIGGSTAAANTTAAAVGTTGAAPSAAPPTSATPVKSTATTTPATTAAPATTAEPATTAPPATSPPTTAPPPTKTPPPQPPSSGAGAAIAFARAQIGKPYQWGGAGPDSFDCSGLTMRAWEAGGVSLPHHAATQYSVTTHVRIADLQPGDLVFFGSDLHHEGLYIGGGQMIEAPQTGQFVRYASIYRSDLQPMGGRPG